MSCKKCIAQWHNSPEAAGIQPDEVFLGITTFGVICPFTYYDQDGVRHFAAVHYVEFGAMGGKMDIGDALPLDGEDDFPELFLKIANEVEWSGER